MSEHSNQTEMPSTPKVSWAATVLRALRRPWRESLWSLRFRFKRVWSLLLPWVPLPVRLKEGIWWLARNDTCGDAIFTGRFEEGERKFVNCFLHRGMTFFDIGAHHGIYALLAALRVGREGRVIAFEPSSRERKRLQTHLWINRLLKDVSVFPLALGENVGEDELYIVDGVDTGCNSLRPPRVTERTHTETIHKTSLDLFVANKGIRQIDFIKIDVEGGELDVLRGARNVLSRPPRPVILIEIADSRTASWGYQASKICEFLAERNYEWYSVTVGGYLRPFQRAANYGANLVAVPREQVSRMLALVSATLGNP